MNVLGQKKRKPSLLLALIVSGQLVGCLSTSLNHKINSQKIVGAWTDGAIERGSGYYMEEDFLSDGRYCTMFFDPEVRKLEMQSGSWHEQIGELRIAIERSSIRILSLIDTSSEELRNLIEVSKTKLVYAYSGPAVKTFVQHRLNRKPDDRWCKFPAISSE